MRFNTFLGNTPQNLLNETSLETGLGSTRKLDYDSFQVTITKSSDEEIYRINFPVEVRTKERICFEFEGAKVNAVIPYNQGQFVPYDYDKELDALPFDGQFASTSAYLPALFFIGKDEGHAVIVEDYEDAGYNLIHNTTDKTNGLKLYFLPSMGEFEGSRTFKIKYFKNPKMDDIFDYIRNDFLERGLLVTLKEKMQKNPRLAELVGASVVHTTIKKVVSPLSKFYDSKNALEVTTFKTRVEQIKALHNMGAGKLYIHIDGWFEAGYDNQHPDVVEICKEAGDVSGLKELFEAVHNSTDLIGLHDQYRDYYHDAKHFNAEHCLFTSEKKPFEMCMWAGGPQSYHCASLALDYVKRNFTKLFDLGIYPDCSYLDVFTCNELDECYNPSHLMTRSQCKEYRLRCFAYLSSKGIMPSSEEVNLWALKELVFCHYAPYANQLRPKASCGYPIPFFNRIAHDCVIIPWILDNDRDLKLAKINGGIGYCLRDGAYPNVDGSFETNPEIIKGVERSKELTELHKKIAYEPMTSFEFINDNPIHQRAVFGDGTVVEVEL